MKKIVGVTYDKGLCIGVTVDGIDDNKPVYFDRIVHGHWKSVDSDVVFECSNCACEVSTSWDYDQDEMWSYCPHCGAKMDEEVKI